MGDVNWIILACYSNVVFIIYGLFVGEAGQIRYVGLTLQPPENRLNQHKRDARRGVDNRTCHWMRSCGVDNINIRVLCHTLTRHDMVLAERWWIAELKNLGYPLTNGTDGGFDGSIGYTGDTIRRISASLTGRKRAPFTVEHRANIGAAQRGRTLPDVTRARTSASVQGLLEPDAYLAILATWKLCSDCGYRYGTRQMISHRNEGKCRRIGNRAVDGNFDVV